MKLMTEETSFETNCVGKETNFQLDADNPIIFQMLRKNIYEDPIGSICREIADNARDAHREVGTPKRPVEISTPGEYLTIKDYGPGISPERMKNIFCFYGASSKRNNNNEGGGFGLGAKTPFAYTDTFTIETIFGGIKYTYIAFIDPTQIGKIKLVSQEKTDECNGTKIKIPVKPHDRSNFCEKIRYYTKWWHLAGDAQPKLLGEITEPPEESVMRGNGWIIYQDSHNNPQIIVNGIPYTASNNICQWPSKVIMIFNVGDLNLSANRESIHFDSDTINQIKLRYENYKKEVKEKLEHELDSINEFCDVINLINVVDGDLSDTKTWKWKGKKFDYPISECRMIAVRKDSWSNRNNYYETNRFSHISKDNIITTIDNQVTTYQKRKAGYYMNANGLKRIYIVPEDLFPVDGMKISDIKINSGNGGSSGKRTAVKVWRACNGHDAGFLNVNQSEDTIYAEKNGKRYHAIPNLSSKFMLVSKGNIRLLKGKWISLTDYMDKELFNKIPTDTLQKIVNYLYTCEHNEKFKFLKDVSDSFSFYKVSENYSQYSSLFDIIKFAYKNGCVSVEEINFQESYPMLQWVPFISYLDKDDKCAIIDYVVSRDKEMNDDSVHANK